MNSPQRQHGTVLMVAMILLAALTLLATGAVENAVVGLKIARNAEESDNAFQTAQAAIDFVVSDTFLLPSTEQPYIDIPIVPETSPLYTPSVAEVLAAAPGESVQLAAAYTGCSVGVQGSSLLTYAVYNYRVSANVDRSDTGRGRSFQREGVAVIGPSQGCQ